MGRSLGATARALAGPARIVAALAILWAIGLVWFAESLPEEVASPAAELDATDAIVVLTGGPLRIRTGLGLLADGKAKKLLVSGVYRGVDVTDLMRVAQQRPASLECCIALGYAADNTEGNAAETRRWMTREGFQSLRLVTASYHMPRSLLEFHRAMPAVRIVPHPVAPEGFHRVEWWRWPGTLALIFSEYHKYLVALARGVLPAGEHDEDVAETGP